MDQLPAISFASEDLGQPKFFRSFFPGAVYQHYVAVDRNCHASTRSNLLHSNRRILGTLPAAI